ncbi:hypothetical protein [Pseudomonas syringae]|uniref:hypothetical protein n=1 Tax=Pseudomonas syringae TaxID=317 RepID=UPI001F0EBC2D|nr:hypothetical protein [Pseudomonas syringae]MCH5487733.1 hypothetical protein [Pseudomonas syringae pv. syringae]MDO1458876.1 hypothetical protein [Pseudomonas syringae pv. syringae]
MECPKKILYVAQAPESVDFTDPGLPPGLDAEKVQAGIELAQEAMNGRGWECDVCFILPDSKANWVLENQLTTQRYDCVVIGAGIRIPARSLYLFEAIVNAVHRHAPHARIAFNAEPKDTADAVDRSLQN